MDLDKATELAMRTDYAHDAVGEEINIADAGAFFLEGYLQATNGPLSVKVLAIIKAAIHIRRTAHTENCYCNLCTALREYQKETP